MKNWPLNQVQMSDKFYMDFSFKPIKRFRIFYFCRYLLPNLWSQIQCRFSSAINTMNWICRKLRSMPQIISKTISQFQNVTDYFRRQSLTILYNSIKSACTLLKCTERELSLFSISSKLEYLPRQLIAKHRSWNLLLLL